MSRIAGIQASKKTSDLIPPCHLLALTHVSLELALNKETSSITCQVKAVTTGPTGVEMEALTVVQVDSLTIYDMAKAVDRSMVMGDVCSTREGWWKVR